MPFNDFLEQDDAVVARLEIDLPDDADVQVQELVKATDDLQTNFEATTRYVDDLTHRYERLAEAQEKLNDLKDKSVEVLKSENEARSVVHEGSERQNEQLIKNSEEQLQRYEKMQERLNNLRNSLERDNLSPEMRGLVQERIGIEETTQNEETLYDLAYARGLVTPELRDGEIRSTYKGKDISEVMQDDRLVTGLRDELAKTGNEERTGVDWGGQATAVGSTVQSLASLTEVSDLTSLTSRAGGVAGAASGIGGLSALAKAIPYLGALTAVLGGANVAAQSYAETSKVGQVQGGGFSEGMEARVDQYKMAALNPFISNEQARSIIMTAMNEGYTGDAYEDVTEFMAKNLEEMNMSVADSMKILKTNVDEGGQSIESLNLQLATMKDLSAQTGISTEQLTKGFQKTTDAFIDTGADAADLGEFGLALESSFTEGPLRDDGGDIIRQMMNSEQGTEQIRRAMGARTDTEGMRKLLEGGTEGTDEQATEMIKKIAQQSNNDPDRFVQRFEAMYGIRIGVNEAEELIRLANEGSIIGSGIEEIAESDKKALEETDKGFWEGMNDRRKSVVSEGQAREEARRYADYKGGSKEERGKNYKEAYERALSEKGDDVYGEGEFGTSGTKYEALERLSKEYGNDSLDVILEDGERISLGEARKREGLNLEKAKFVEKGGDESEALNYTQFRGKESVEEVTGEADTNVKIDLTDDAKKVLKVDSVKSGRSPHKEKAYAGSDGRRPNNAPVGEDG